MHRVRGLAPLALALLVVASLSLGVAAQPAEHAPAAAAEHGQPAEHAADDAHGEAAAHEASLADLFWPVVNFAILCGVLYYFLRAPLSGYLKDRGESIRKDLVDAAAIKAAATAQLDEIDRKLKALPGEIEALRARGQAEIAGEEQRISQQAVAERDRLLEQARRDIDVQVRLAKRELTEHAADLALELATERIATETTPADHARLVDRYLQQVKR
jgi:F-type H+-transporting ATPase subunit b